MGYLIIASGPPGDKTLAVELWVSTEQPYAVKGGEQLCFSSKHFPPVHHTPRHLCAKCSAPQLTCTFAVAPARHNGIQRTSEQREMWRRELQHLVRRYRANFSLSMRMPG
eukprot:4651853-Pyramimonas_sp.AAC.1